MNTPNLSLVVHGVLALAVIIAGTIMVVLVKTIPADVIALFGVILGVSGTNGATAVRAVTKTDTQNDDDLPPLQGGALR